MMTLDEAIIHAEEVANNLEKQCSTTNKEITRPVEGVKGISVTVKSKELFESCAAEHRQLAEWLKELKRLKSKELTLDDVIDILQNEQECVKRAAADKCNRKCEKCDLLRDTDNILKAYEIAIKNLKTNNGWQDIKLWI